MYECTTLRKDNNQLREHVWNKRAFFLIPKKCIFSPFLTWQPYSLSHVDALRINLSYSPKDQSLKFSWKNIENWLSWKMKLCFVFCFVLFFVIGFFKNIFFCFFSLKITMAFIWGSVYFCTMNGFFRILKKALSELICTRLYVKQLKLV